MVDLSLSSFSAPGFVSFWIGFLLSFSSLAVPRYTTTHSASSSLVRDSPSVCSCSSSRSPPHCCLPVMCLSYHFVLGFLGDFFPSSSFRALSAGLSLPLLFFDPWCPSLCWHSLCSLPCFPILVSAYFAILRSFPRHLLPQPPPTFVCFIVCGLATSRALQWVFAIAFFSCGCFRMGCLGIIP